MSATDAEYHDPTAARLGTAWKEGAVLQEVLGLGGTAVVYGSTLEDGTQVAVKVLHPEWLNDVEIRSSFEFESHLLAQLNHPGLPTSLGQGTLATGEPFYVMERLQGALLSDVVAGSGGMLPAPDVFHILDRTLEVLAVLHAEGIVHRDIKPSNLFLTIEGTVKLLDLGAALLLHDASRPAAQRLIGSPSYMAPEQATNATLGVDRRSDVFAVGATMYHLLSGQPVRAADSVDALFQLASTVPPGSLSRVVADAPATLARLVDRALAWVPADRFADANEMLEALRVVAAAEQIPPSPLAVAGGNALRQALGLSFHDERTQRSSAQLQRIQASLRELFRRMSRCILALRRYTPDSPDFLDRFGPAREALEIAFRDIGDDIRLVVRPNAFEFEELPVWEPEVGLDDVPYFLFQSGFRAIRIRTDVENSEFVRFMRLMSVDPLRDLAFEDDLSTVFFEGSFDAIEADILSGFDVDLLDSYESFGQQVKSLTQELDAEARRAGGGDRGMSELAAALGRQGVSEADAVDLQFSAEDAEAVLGLWETQDIRFWQPLPERAEDQADRWRERGVRTLVHAYHRAIADRQPGLVLDRIRDRVLQLSQGAALPEALIMLASMVALCEPSAAMQLLDYALIDDLTEKLLHVATQARPQWPDRPYAHEPEFAALLSHLPPRCTPSLVDVWLRVTDEALVERFAEAVSTRVAGQDAIFGAVLGRAPEVHGMHILRWLAAVGDPSTTRYIAQALANPSEYVQAAALSLLMPRGHKPVDRALEGLLRSRESKSRRTALRLIEAFRPDTMGVVLEAIAREPRFNDLPLAERQAIMVTLRTLAPQATRQLLDELIRPHSWARDNQESPTRQLAAELLVALYPDRDTIEALDREVRRLFRTPAEVRDTMNRLLQDLRQKVTREGGV